MTAFVQAMFVGNTNQIMTADDVDDIIFEVYDIGDASFRFYDVLSDVHGGEKANALYDKAVEVTFVLKKHVSRVTAILAADAVNGAIAKASGSIAVSVNGFHFNFAGVDEIRVPPTPTTADVPKPTTTERVTATTSESVTPMTLAAIVPLREDPQDLEGKASVEEEGKLTQEVPFGKGKSAKGKSGKSSSSKPGKVTPTAATAIPVYPATISDPPQPQVPDASPTTTDVPRTAAALDVADSAAKVVGATIATGGKGGGKAGGKGSGKAAHADAKAGKAAKANNAAAAKAAKVAAKAAKSVAKEARVAKSSAYSASQKVPSHTERSTQRKWFFGGVCATVACIALYIENTKAKHRQTMLVGDGESAGETAPLLSEMSVTLTGYGLL